MFNEPNSRNEKERYSITLLIAENPFNAEQLNLQRLIHTTQDVLISDMWYINKPM